VRGRGQGEGERRNGKKKCRIKFQHDWEPGGGCEVKEWEER
jgi:hypothetical protein